MGEAGLAGFTQGQAAQKSTKDQVVWLHLRLSLVPSWYGASRTIWNCWKWWGISSLHRAAAVPRSSPDEKRVWKLVNRNLICLCFCYNCFAAPNVTLTGHYLFPIGWNESFCCNYETVVPPGNSSIFYFGSSLSLLPKVKTLFVLITKLSFILVLLKRYQDDCQPDDCKLGPAN